VQTQKPDVGDDLYECAIVVPVGNLMPSPRIQVTEDSNELGVGNVAQTAMAVVTVALHSGLPVSAREIACEGTEHEIVGAWADPTIVKPAPSRIPTAGVDKSSLIPGNDTVLVTGLLVGAGPRS
jgi:hypothetical protein